MKITIKISKPRNQFATPARQRKAGSHTKHRPRQKTVKDCE